MALSIPTYLRLSRHHIFYFRWPIPAALHPLRQLRHVETSLATRDTKTALQLARYLAYHAGKLNWNMAVGMEYSEIQKHLKAHFANMLTKHKELLDKNGPLSIEGFAAVQNVHDFLEFAIRNDEDDYLPYESIDDDLADFIRIRKLDIAKDTQPYRQLKDDYKLPYLSYCREVLAYNAGLRNYDLSAIPAPQLQSPSVKNSIPLKQLISDFVDERIRGDEWTDRTRKDREAQLALLSEILTENMDIAGVDSIKAMEVKKILQAIPKNRFKNPKSRGLSLQDALKVLGVEKMHTRTVNEYLTVYQSLFSWAETNGYIAKNPFKNLAICQKKTKQAQRAPFNSDQIKEILAALPSHSPEKSGKSYRYWGVMLAMYTGARLNEIAQLSLDDIREEGGIWYFDINDENLDDDTDKKRLKNEGSKRRVPIHSALLSAGLLEHANSQRKAGHTRLFHDLKFMAGHGYGRYLARWVNDDFLVDLKIKEKTLSFHSFRHSFIKALRNAGVELPTVQELVGHSKEAVTETVYNRTAYPLPILKAALDKLAY